MKNRKIFFTLLIILALFSFVYLSGASAATNPNGSDSFAVIGKGCTTAYYIDKDCDGYGVASPIGPDADDNDPAVNTPESILPFYDGNRNGKIENEELKRFLRERAGYDVRNVYYFSPGGSDATGEVNNPDRPFGLAGYGSNPMNNWAAFFSRVQPGDAVVFRGGDYKWVHPVSGFYFAVNFPRGGEPGDPIVLMSYPGEKAILDAPTNISMGHVSDIVVDGLELANTLYPQQCRAVDGRLVNNIVLRNLDIHSHKWGLGPSGDSHNLLFENNVIHDNLGEHGIYIGCNEASGPNSDITIRGNVIYRNHRTGIQHNGRVTNLVIENNIIHSNDMAGISLEMGVSHSFIRNNLIFNNMKQGIVFYNYYEGNDYILPYDQMHNVIENNTIWVGRYNWNGSGTSVSDHGAIVFNNGGIPEQGIRYLDYNTIRNNILVTYNGPVFWFHQRDYADTTTITNNIIYRVTGQANVMQYGDAPALGDIYYNMQEFEAFSPLFQGNVFADPLFRDVAVNYYNTPEKFNFDLLASSPALGFGLLTGAPSSDLRGAVRDASIDAGCYEYSSSTPPVNPPPPPPPPPATIYGDVSGDGAVNASDVLLLAQHIVGLTTLNSTQTNRGDVSGNGQVTAYDVSLILKKVLGLINTFPVE